MNELELEWTEYMQYRASLRGFDLVRIADLVRHSPERYVDDTTGRLLAVGKCQGQLVLVPYEFDGRFIRPVTVHATNRTQIEARIKAGRYRHE
ncbi:MAG: hypothetical protein GC168_07675 [Candidatus Hydrogenedens sp.]|nr:hypothetical protein [Candidatus Hydrogenedens sp.]